jgi:23S rRNA (guanosine2251-2'-O)-methyltransferase
MSDKNRSYSEKKAFLKGILTIYGRKAVLEALQQKLDIHCLHIADSNKPAAIISEILTLAEKNKVDVQRHSKLQLSRISRNSKQDQGVAADIICPGFSSFDQFISTVNKDKKYSLLALENITNPQNVGMIIRSACAGFIDALLIPEHGTSQLGPLVIKASAGTVFKAPIIRCEQLGSSLKTLKKSGFRICTLSSHASQSLFDYPLDSSTVFVLGNESEGVSRETAALADSALQIPMNNGVESLNVAVTAALISFRCSF